jgi:hypothetical protein
VRSERFWTKESQARRLEKSTPAVIPGCHRVSRQDSNLEGYGLGSSFPVKASVLRRSRMPTAMPTAACEGDLLGPT